MDSDSLNGSTSKLTKAKPPISTRKFYQLSSTYHKLQKRACAVFGFSRPKETASTLDKIIAPEIKNDPFFEHLHTYASNPRLRTFLEIGSSSGGGSTEAFVKGIRKRSNKESVSLYCMELSQARFQLLKETYHADSFVKAFNLSSISSSEFPSEADVIYFYKNIPTKLNNTKLKTVLDWYRADLDYIQKSNNDQNGIEFIKHDQSIIQFDMVLIDGSEFTGERELELVIGASVIALDDTETYKCHAALQRLSKDQRYKLITHRPEIRNGYAIFERKDFTQ